MGQRYSGNDNIEGALRLDGDPAAIRAYYDQWAADYEADVASERYSGPQWIGKLLEDAACELLPDKRAHLTVLDAGCGTGLTGVELARRGFSCIDGFDLSPDMAAVAAALPAYRDVRGNVDLLRATEDYAENSYDIVCSCGVFTLGHVPATALHVLLALARPGGTVVLSTRNQFVAQGNFHEVSNAVLDSGQARLLRCVRDAPYSSDDNAHYWAYRVL